MSNIVQIQIVSLGEFCEDSLFEPIHFEEGVIVTRWVHKMHSGSTVYADFKMIDIDYSHFDICDGQLRFMFKVESTDILGDIADDELEIIHDDVARILSKTYVCTGNVDIKFLLKDGLP